MTAATATITERVRDFVAAVGEHFLDLPDAERHELLTDLEQHFTELAAEAPDVLEAELADSAAYAAELRAGAGIGEKSKGSGRVARLRRGARDRVRAVLDHPRTAPLHEYLPMLRPAWWIVRAWALVVVVALLFQGGTEWWPRHILIPGRNLVGLVALMAAVAVSVRAGMAGTDQGRVWRIANRVAGFAVAVVAWVALTAAPGQTIYVESYPYESPPHGLLTHSDGEGITNLYVYDAEGRLLEDVFVYDGSGRPVEIGPETDDYYGIRSEPQIDADGRIVANVYPIVQYVSDGEGALIRREPPAVDVPRLARSPESPSTTVPAEAIQPMPVEPPMTTRPALPAP
jgi:hypothetical protein